MAGVVVEELTFEVAPEDLGRWLQREHEVWSPFLRAQHGYRGKEVWRPADEPSQVRVLVWWESLAAWQAVPAEEVERVEAQMGQLRRRSHVRQSEVLRALDR